MLLGGTAGIGCFRLGSSAAYGEQSWLTMLRQAQAARIKLSQMWTLKPASQVWLQVYP